MTIVAGLVIIVVLVLVTYRARRLLECAAELEREESVRDYSPKAPAPRRSRPVRTYRYAPVPLLARPRDGTKRVVSWARLSHRARKRRKAPVAPGPSFYSIVKRCYVKSHLWVLRKPREWSTNKGVAANTPKEDTIMSKPTRRELQDEAREYYALCREAERLGIPTSLDDANTPATVEALRAAVNRGRTEWAEEPVIGERASFTTTASWGVATGSGTYLGVALDEEDGVPYHYLADGEVNGHPQTSQGFPADPGTPPTTGLTPTSLIKAHASGAGTRP